MMKLHARKEFHHAPYYTDVEFIDPYQHRQYAKIVKIVSLDNKPYLLLRIYELLGQHPIFYLRYLALTNVIYFSSTD